MARFKDLSKDIQPRAEGAAIQFAIAVVSREVEVEMDRSLHY